MKTIIRELAMLLSFVLAGMLLFVLLLIDIIFKIIRFIRYGYIMILMLVMKYTISNESVIDSWNKNIMILTMGDIQYSTMQMEKTSIKKES